MTKLRRKMGTQFPEVRGKLRKGDGPYDLFVHLTAWLLAARREAITADFIRRLREFLQWIQTQPEGETADDDLCTIALVTFWEPLCESDSLRDLIPQLMSCSDFEGTAQYFKAWSGTENYEKVLRHFGKSV